MFFKQIYLSCLCIVYNKSCSNVFHLFGNTNNLPTTTNNTSILLLVFFIPNFFFFFLWWWKISGTRVSVHLPLQQTSPPTTTTTKYTLSCIKLFWLFAFHRKLWKKNRMLLLLLFVCIAKHPYYIQVTTQPFASFLLLLCSWLPFWINLFRKITVNRDHTPDNQRHPML